MVAEIIDGRAIAKEIRKEITDEITKLKTQYKITPKIITLKVGNDPSSELYLKLRTKACEEVGIISTKLELPEDITEKKLIEELEKQNTNEEIHGILVQFPLPPHISPEKIMNTINPKKDVEGFNPINMGKILSGDEHLIPCTPLSVLTLLEHEKIKLKGKNITIVNHSNVVGKPLTVLFLNRNATVSTCHVFTPDIKPITQQADILVTATGIAKFITKDHIKKDAIIIDVGITPTKDGICGDVDFESVKNTASKVTPVPGGVGPVTIACCLKNIIKTYKNCVKNCK